jgi:hypothetical protein
LKLGNPIQLILSSLIKMEIFCLGGEIIRIVTEIVKSDVEVRSEARGVPALGQIHHQAGTAVLGKWNTGGRLKSLSATRKGTEIASRTDMASTATGTDGAIERRIVPPIWTQKWQRPMLLGPNWDCLH